MFETWLFYAFAAILLVSGVLVITARNPVHAALFLVLAFFTAAGIWLLLRAEFLAIALVLVYVGAVMVLFLFVVMMLDINLERLREGFWSNLPLALVVGGIMVLEMVRGARQPHLRHAPGRGRRPATATPRSSAACSTRSTSTVRDRGGAAAGGDRRGHRADAAPAQGQPLAGSGRAGEGAARGARASWSRMPAETDE